MAVWGDSAIVAVGNSITVTYLGQEGVAVAESERKKRVYLSDVVEGFLVENDVLVGFSTSCLFQYNLETLELTRSVVFEGIGGLKSLDSTHFVGWVYRQNKTALLVFEVSSLAVTSSAVLETHLHALWFQNINKT